MSRPPVFLLPRPTQALDRIAWGSLAAGSLSLATAIVLLFVSWAVTWPAVLGAVGISMGVVGLARARRFRSGRGAAIGGISCGAIACVLTTIEWFLAWPLS